MLHYLTAIMWGIITSFCLSIYFDNSYKLHTYFFTHKPINILLLLPVFFYILDCGGILTISIILMITSLAVIFIFYIRCIIFINSRWLTHSKFPWVEWENAYNSHCNNKANELINKNNFNLNKVYSADIENDVSSHGILSWLLTFLCAIALMLCLLVSWNDFSHYEGWSSYSRLLVNIPIVRSLFAFMSIMIIVPIWSSHIMIKLMKITNLFYKLHLSILDLFEDSWEIIIPFYTSEIALFLSAYFTSHCYHMYMCISLLTVAVFALFIAVGVNAHLRMYIKDTNHNYRMNKMKLSYLHKDSLYIDKTYLRKVVVEIPTKYNGVIEVPLKNIH